MNKEIDALVEKAWQQVVLGNSLDGKQAIRSALMEARALGLEEAAKHVDSEAAKKHGDMFAVLVVLADELRALRGE